MKAAFFTLGCKVNQYETQEMTEHLRRNGYEIVSDKEDADIYIINSCSVTAESDRKTRQAVRHFRRRNSDAIVVLTGCMPQVKSDVPLILPQADIVMGNKSNAALVRNIQRFLERREPIVDLVEHKKGDSFEGSQISTFDGHTRAFVKIQDGCDRFCSYCIIPYARGRSRSKSLEEIKKELESLVENGYSEVVFVGINLSSYGRDLGLSLCDAVELAEEVGGILRIRLGSLEPDHITDEVLGRLSVSKKFCPHFHLSLQSGSNSILKRMNRHYSADEFKDIVVMIRAAFENPSITTDIIVGFPGETEEEFEQTLSFARKIRFDKVHVFPYSLREGTKAASMPHHIDKATKSKRSGILSVLCDDIRAEILKGQIGKTYSVLIERGGRGYSFGHTMSYEPVTIKDTEITSGTMADVLIVSADKDGCTAVLS